MALFAAVHLHDGLCVDGQVLVGVDHHAEQPGICLENTHTRAITSQRGLNDCFFINVCERDLGKMIYLFNYCI